jgi:hypothetical protein
MQPAAGISRSRRTRSSCKDRSSGASISQSAVAVSRFEFAVGTTPLRCLLMVITQQAAQSLAALNRPVAAGVCTPREQQDIAENRSQRHPARLRRERTTHRLFYSSNLLTKRDQIFGTHTWSPCEETGKGRISETRAGSSAGRAREGKPIRTAKPSLP